MNDCATTHRRWGYTRAWARATSEGIVVGRDTFRRLWRAEGLRVRPRKAPKPRIAPRLQPLVRASAPGQVWAIDVQFDSDWKGRVLKVCHLIDEFTRQHLAVRVERRMGAADVIDMHDLAVLTHGAPQVLRARIHRRSRGTLGQRARHTPSTHPTRPAVAGRIRGVLTQPHA